MNVVKDLESERASKSGWERFKKWLNKFVLILDYDPTADRQEAMRLLEEEIELLKTRLDQLESG